MQLILIGNDKLNRCTLPEKRNGRYWLKRSDATGAEADLISVEGIGGNWVLQSNKQAQLLDKDDKSVRERVVKAGHFCGVYIPATQEKALIYTRPDTVDRSSFRKYLLPKSGTLTIGRSAQSSICFANNYASSQHALLTVSGATLTVTDAGSTNGTFVNDARVQQAQLKPGDVLSIVDLTIIVGQGFFAINNPDGAVHMARNIRPLSAQRAKPAPGDEEIEESSPEYLFFRSPRLRRSVGKPTVKIDAPPAEEKPDTTPLLMVLGPTITMGMSSAMMAVFAIMQVRPDANGHRNYSSALPLVFMSVLMMTGMILFPILSRRYEKKKRIKNEEKRKERYRAYLQKTAQAIENEKALQSEIMHENYADLQTCVERIRQRERSLWERTEGHEDFLDVRLGIGDWPFSADFQVPQRSFTLDDDTLQDELFAIVESPRVVHSVPFVVSLTKQFSLGVIGERLDTAAYLKILIFQIASLHAYDEVKFLFIYNPQEQAEWDFVRWLPHTWTDDHSLRFVATNIDEVRQLSAFLEQAQERYRDTDDRADGAADAKYVVFALDRDLATKCEALNNVFRARNYRGVSVIAVYDELRYLPKDCKVVLALNETYSRIFDRSVTTGEQNGFMPDQDFRLDAHNLALTLANTRLETAATVFALPTVLTFLEMYGVGKVEHLNARARWKESNPVQSLEAPIGVDEGGNLCNLDLHERVHGPHGLIAGMTGSGKSEFIMTFILSLALNYHPHEVAFVLIDYKGGGMANAFAHLPHTVGVITNLDGASVNRSLASIQSELKRRQAIFNAAAQQAHISNIDIYRYQSLYREGQVSEPLPHLFIISDEFAELKTQQPEFMEQLVSAARIGRSLGVHLILATQKPSGVVDDQIWANSKFKICLKVQDKADSMEMIKRPEAAELVETGRFYLQVGYNELFELGQSAWAGATYYPADRVARDYDDSVTLLNLQGRPLVQVKPQQRLSATGGKTKQLDEVTNYLIGIAKEEHLALRPLWLPPLDARVYLTPLRAKYRELVTASAPYTLDAFVGEYDDPATQTQGLVNVSLSRDGNLLLFGMTGGGKTHFLNALLYSLFADHSPLELNCYLLDFGSETMTSFRPAPQTGDVLLSADTEKITNLFKMLDRELAYRKKLFADYGGEYQSYVRESGKTVPNILVVINNYSAFSELFDESDEWLAGSLTREGAKFGIYFILTAANSGAVRYRLQQNFKQTICLQTTDADEYSMIFGRIGGLAPAQTPGRGLFRNEDGVYEFQTALISEELADSPRELRLHFAALASEYSGPVARPVPSLPVRVTPDLLPLTDASYEKRQIPIGIEKESMEVCTFDFARQNATFVMASADGWRAFLQALARLLEAGRSGCVGVLCAQASDAAAFYAGAPALEVAQVIAYGAAGDTGDVAVDAAAAGGDAAGAASGADEDASAADVAGLDLSITFCVVAGLADLYDNVPYEHKANFVAGLKRLATDAKITLLIGESSSAFGAIAYESWISELTSLDTGIWVGGGFGEQYYLKSSGASYFKDPGRGFGVALVAGEALQVKLLEEGGAGDE